MYRIFFSILTLRCNLEVVESDFFSISTEESNGMVMNLNGVKIIFSYTFAKFKGVRSIIVDRSSA